MQVQGIDLSELEIIRRFSEMEKKFPRCTGNNYFPSLDFYIEYYDNPEKSIKTEADNMFAFVGMGIYCTEVRFEALQNAAGNIKLSADNKAYITIDDSTAKDAKKVLATLAHELCHKILFKNGIYFSNFLEEENEIYADLATFYVGFGHLTMEGYKVGNSISGYLTPSTYARAFNIIKTINRNVEYNISYLPDHAKAELGKVESESVFSKWLKDFLNTNKLSEIFMVTCDNISNAQNMCSFLISILHDKSEQFNDALRKMSQTFYGFDEKDFEWHKFSIAFKYMENAAIDKKLQNDSSKYIEEISRLSSSLFDLLGDNYEQAINTINHSYCCPICGMPINKQLENKRYHLKCPKCKNHIVIDADKSSISYNIKYVEQERKKIFDKYITEIKNKSVAYDQLLEEKESLSEVIKNYETKIAELEKELDKNKKWYKRFF